MRNEDDTPFEDTSDEDHEYDDREEFSDDENVHGPDESMHLSATMEDFRPASRPRIRP